MHTENPQCFAQIVADVPMLEGIKGEWTLQRSPQPSALTLSLAYDNFLRLRAEAEEHRFVPGKDGLHQRYKHPYCWQDLV